LRREPSGFAFARVAGAAEPRLGWTAIRNGCRDGTSSQRASYRFAPASPASDA